MIDRLGHAEHIRRILTNHRREAMTTKHFRPIAFATFKASVSMEERRRHAEMLADAFAKFGAFNRDRFIHACLTGKWDHAVGRKVETAAA